LLGNPGVLAMIEHHAVLYADLVDPLAMLAAPRGSTALARYWPYAAADAPDAVARESTRAYTRLMSASQQLVAGEILDAYDVAGHRCVLDVGGGDGTFLRALAARAPQTNLMLFDLPGVAAEAEAAFATAGLAARTRIVPGDFSRDALPAGADLITFVRVLHDHDDPRVERMLRAAYEALPPGGRLVVAESLAGTAGAARMGDAYFGVYLWAMGSGRPRTAEELTAMLRKAGFRRIRRRPTRIPLQTSVLVAERG
jgi:demethylspheroidene O-methyltransferase